MEKKSSKGLVVLVVLMFLIILGLVGYICYDKGVFDGLLGKEEVKQEKEEKLSEEEVMKLHDSLLMVGADLYFSKDVSVDNIDDYDIISFALNSYAKANNLSSNVEYSPCYDEKYSDNSVHICQYIDELHEKQQEVSKDKVVSISKDVLDNYIKSFFNTTRIFSAKNLKIYGDGNDHNFASGVGFVYSESDNKFYQVNPARAGAEVIIAEARIIKTEQADGNLYVFDKVAVCMLYPFGTCRSLSNDDNSKFVSASNNMMETNYVYDAGIIKTTSDGVKSFDFDYVFDKHSDLFNTHKTTFKKADDGKYYWYSSEIVNE